MSDSHPYNIHAVNRLRAALRNLSPEEAARRMGLSVNRLCYLLGNDHGRVCLRTRQHWQDVTGLTWCALNEGPEDNMLNIPTRWTFGAWVGKAIRRIRAAWNCEA